MPSTNPSPRIQTKDLLALIRNNPTGVSSAAAQMNFTTVTSGNMTNNQINEFLGKLPSTYTYNGKDTLQIYTAIAKTLNLGATLTKITKGVGSVSEGSSSIDTVNVIKNPNGLWPSSDYKFNLPPHGSNIIATGNRIDPDFNSEPHVRNSSNGDTTWGMPRRGMIWWDKSSTITGDNSGADKNKVITPDSDAAFEVPFNNVNSHLYGFVFLWNPSQVNISTGVDMNRQAPTGDKYVGAFGDNIGGSQTLSLTLVLDRSIDFAYLGVKADGLRKSISELSEADCESFSRYYSYESSNKGNLTSSTNTNTIRSQISDLARRGTIYDIDYLYRTINGDSWHRFGIENNITGDIGYLYYTVVNISIGPMLYSGVVSSLNVSHNMFVENMTPIMSTLELSIDLRATARAITSIAGVTSPLAASRVAAT